MPDQKTVLWPLALSRVMIGILWLLSLRWKLPPDFIPIGDHRSLMEWLQLEIQHPAFSFYGSFVETVIIPNFILFAWIIFLAELLTGFSLLTGTLTRLGGLVGLLMSINLGIGLLEVPGEWPWSYMMMVMWHGVFVMTAPGRVWGVDNRLRQRLPPASFWRWLT